MQGAFSFEVENQACIHALVGACCAILIFVFVLSPRLDVVQASSGSCLRYKEAEKYSLLLILKTYISCSGECDSENKNYCSGGAKKGGSCLYYEEVVVEQYVS